MSEMELRLPYQTSASDRSARAIREIQDLYNRFLVRLPTQSKVQLFDTDPVKPLNDPATMMFGIIHNISQRLQFFFSSNVLKARNLIEGLAWALADGNYLVWTLVARSLLEHSAVLSKYLSSLDSLGVEAEERTLLELEGINDCLYKYMHGTRFHWDALLRGEWDELQKKFDPPTEESALNVLTAIDHSIKLRPALSANRIWYDMLSDFAHPNKASHTLYVGLVNTDERGEMIMTELDVQPKTPVARAEFILRWTLPAVVVNAGSIEGSLRRLAPIVRLWSARTEGTVDVLAQGKFRFTPGDDKA
jgi:hypothetical protein